MQEIRIKIQTAVAKTGCATWATLVTYFITGKDNFPPKYNFMINLIHRLIRRITSFHICIYIDSYTPRVCASIAQFEARWA